MEVDVHPGLQMWVHDTEGAGYLVVSLQSRRSLVREEGGSCEGGGRLEHLLKRWG